MGQFLHACEGELVCETSPSQSKIPYFNAPIYLSNKTQIGKVEEILGPLNKVFFTVKLSEGVVATSFKAKDTVYIGPDKLLPLDRFLPKPVAPGGKVQKALGRQGMMPARGRGGARGSFGGRGGARGGSCFGAGRGGASRGGGFTRGASRGGSFGGSSGGFGGRGRGR
jgi:H/ACA ribonucleoprotein complex subunit 1